MIKAKTFYFKTINNPLLCEYAIAPIKERVVYILFPGDIFTVDDPEKDRLSLQEKVIQYVPTNAPT